VRHITIADRRRSSASGWSLHTRDRSPLLELDSDREIEPVEVERDFDVFWVQIRTGRIVKTRDFATGQDQSTNSLWITRPAFKPVAKVDGAEFILARSVDAIVAQRDEGDLIG